MAKKRIPSAFELNRKMQRMFNLKKGDMFCDDFSNEKLPRSYSGRILDEENPIPLGYSLNKGFVRYEIVEKDILVDPVSGNIYYKKIGRKWVDQRTENVIQVGPKKKELISGIISGLEKSANSEDWKYFKTLVILYS